MHIIFLHCWHTVEIAATPLPLESHLPPSVSSSSSTSTDKINAATTAPRLIFLYPGSSLFPIIISGVDKCLSHLLSGFTTASWNFGYQGFFFPSQFSLLLHFFFTLLWIRHCICACQHFCKSGPQACFIAFCRLWEFYFYKQYAGGKALKAEMKLLASPTKNITKRTTAPSNNVKLLKKIPSNWWCQLLAWSCKSFATLY